MNEYLYLLQPLCIFIPIFVLALSHGRGHRQWAVSLPHPVGALSPIILR